MVLTSVTAFSLMAFAITVYVRSGGETIRIEIDDPTASVLIDDGTVTIKGIGETVTLKPGKHSYEVRRGNEVIQGPVEFTVYKGDNPALKITLSKQPMVADADDFERSNVAIEPPPAVDPLDHEITEVRRFEGHTGRIKSLAFSPDGRFVLSGAVGEHTLWLWDVATGRDLWSLNYPGGAASVAISPDGRKAAAGGYGGDVTLLDFATGRKISKLAHKRGISLFDLAFSPDGRLLLSCGCGMNENTARLWDVASGDQIHQFDVEGRVWSAAISADGRFALLGADAGIVLMDLQARKEVRRLIGQRGVVSVDFSPDGRYAVSASYSPQDTAIRLWDVATGQPIRPFIGHSAIVRCVRFLPDGRTLVSGSDDKTLRLWDVQSGRELMRVDADNHVFSCLAVAPDGRHVVAGGGWYGWLLKAETDGDYAIRLWRLPKSEGNRQAGTDEWQTLFNGRDLSGWTVLEPIVDTKVREPALDDIELRKAPDSRGWKSQDGLLICEGLEKRVLAYNEILDDFEVSMEIRLPPKPYRGLFQVIFRAKLSDGLQGSALGFLQTRLHDEKQNNRLSPTWKSGGIHAAVAPAAPALLPQGEWNTLHIRCEAHRVQITLNGIQTVNTNLNETLLPELRDLVPESGLFGFFGYESSKGVQIRNIRLRKLTPPNNVR